MPTFRDAIKLGTKVPMMKTDDYNDQSVTEEKLKDGAITTRKIADGSVTKDKLDSSIRQEINESVTASNEATEKAKEATVKADQATGNAKQATAAATAAKEAADTATQLATTATAASNQATEQAKAATTKADEATARANEAAQKADDSREQTEQTLGTMQEVVDKVAIKDEEGTLVETPFRYIQNEEFIFAKVDAEDKLLFGIQWDGTPVFGKTSAVEDRLQSQVTLLAERVATIMGDEDTTNVIDTMNELKKFFAEIENTQNLTSILANLNSLNTKFGEDIKNLQDTKVDKEEGKSLIEDEVKECFRVIENEDFIMAVVDSEDRALFGLYRATGKPYYPLNDMYHVEQNEEFFALWLDSANHVLLGIRRDGQIIGEIHAVNVLKQVISQLQSDVSSLQEKVGTIDTNLKELLDVFSLQENPEYLAVEKDADGKVLSSTNLDGSHYIHNAKSETIPTEFEHIEDPEGRTEITTDADDKVLAYRDSEGKKHEHSMETKNLEVSNLNLQGNSVNNIQEALKANGFNAKTPIDWSNNSFIQIPEPYLAKINLTNINAMPTSKTDDFHAWLEFWDMQGNYFKKRVILNAQGNSSLQYVKKNFAADFCNDEWVGDDTFSIRIGAWVAQDSFHFKAYYAPDVFKGVCPVSYKFMDEIVKTRGIIKDRQWKRCLLPTEETIGVNPTNLENASIKTLLDDGARGFPDGFPCVVYLNDSFYGIFSWQLKKHRDNMHQDKGNASHIHLDGNISYQTITLADGNLDWDIINGKTPVGSDNNKDGIEIRNPKSLICIDGSKYDGDNNRKELIDEESPSYDSTNKNHLNSAKVKTSLIKFSTYIPTLKRAENENKSESEIKNMIMQYFETESIIDYIIFSDVVNNRDGFRKNWQWVSYDGNKFGVEVYDTDQILGSSGEGIISGHLGNTLDLPTGWIIKYMSKELESRYKVLRDENIISAKNITNLLSNWCSRIGIENYKKEYNKWENSNVNDNIYRVSLWLDKNIAECDKIFKYL